MYIFNKDDFWTFELFLVEHFPLTDKVNQRLDEVHVPQVEELVLVGRHQPLERVPQEDELERPGQDFWREIRIWMEVDLDGEVVDHDEVEPVELDQLVHDRRFRSGWNEIRWSVL